MQPSAVLNRAGSGIAGDCRERRDAPVDPAAMTSSEEQLTPQLGCGDCDSQTPGDRSTRKEPIFRGLTPAGHEKSAIHASGLGCSGSEYAPGEVLAGRYELLCPIAAGGMGTVWRAHHRVLDVQVALKVTRCPADASSPWMERALSEARLAAQLAHPSICRVLDFGVTERGDAFVVTELLQGEALDQRLELQSRFEPTMAVQIMLGVLDALEAAHEKGIVHCDVKPSNIFLDAGRPKLMDFGIARRQSARALGSPPGTVSGTPSYMSPEQALGSDPVDARSDLWSACGTLYELLTGRPPFEGTDCHSVLCAVLKTEPRPLAELGVEDRALSAIVLRGLRKAPSERWRSAGELAVALANWLLMAGVESDASGQALRARWLPRSRQPSVRGSGGRWVDHRARSLFALAGVLLIGSAAWAAVRTADEAERREAVTAAQRSVPTADSGVTRTMPRASSKPASTPSPAPPVGELPVVEPHPKHAAPATTAGSAFRDRRAAQPAAAGRLGKTSSNKQRESGGNAMGYDFGF
jgi:serine/threonine protein kinase